MTANALTIPFERIADPAVRAIAERVTAGTRLTMADGVALFESPDLTGVGVLADAVNRAKHGDVNPGLSRTSQSPVDMTNCSHKMRPGRKRPAIGWGHD